LRAARLKKQFLRLIEMAKSDARSKVWESGMDRAISGGGDGSGGVLASKSIFALWGDKDDIARAKSVGLIQPACLAMLRHRPAAANEPRGCLPSRG
jgi:hypothetical protein